jgi:hypothetical protein
VAVPRYYFHVRDGHDILDEDGIELSGPDDAREQAVIAVGEALRDTGRRFWKEREWRMWVVNESGETVCDIDVSGT